MVRESTVFRAPRFLQYARGFQCVCSEIDPSGCEGKIQAAHIRCGTDGGIGMKPSDRFVFPACEAHHAEQHRIGEKSFAGKYKLVLLQIADRLWRRWITTTDSGRKFAEQLRGVSPAEGPTPTNPPEST
jgi:hypothetical protein